jgi:hypothetical protein
MPPAARYAPFVYVFTPFALLLTVGNLYVETSPNLTFERVIVTILISGAFALPAVVLFFLRDQATASPLLFRYWQLFWVFGFVGYALHFYYSAGVWFDWDFVQIIRRQGMGVVIANCLLLVLWGADAALAMCGQGVGGHFGVIVRWAAHVLFVIAFVTAAVIFRSDVRTAASLVLGVAVAVGAASALALRWWRPTGSTIGRTRAMLDGEHR